VGAGMIKFGHAFFFFENIVVHLRAFSREDKEVK
jgi:hypothetical protein